MQRIGAIAINTFREAVRDRVLYAVFGCATAVLVLTLALAELSLEQQARVVMDLGLASTSLFSVIIAVFLGSSLLYKEIDKKTLYVILPKPVHRWEFLVGKYGGIVLTAIVFIATMGAVQLWVATAQAGGLGWTLVGTIGLAVIALAVVARNARDVTPWLIPWALATFALATLLARSHGIPITVTTVSFLLTLCEVMVLASVATLFSSFSTPFLTGLLTLGVWLVGRSADEMAAMKQSVLPEAIVHVLHVLVEVIPNLNLFVPGRHTLESEAAGGPWMYAATSAGYGLSYTVLMLLAAAALFRRRDFL